MKKAAATHRPASHKPVDRRADIVDRLECDKELQLHIAEQDLPAPFEAVRDWADYA